VYASVRVSDVCCRVRGRVPGGEGRAPRQKVEEAEAQS
jgi:hypothetical protein